MSQTLRQATDDSAEIAATDAALTGVGPMGLAAPGAGAVALEGHRTAVTRNEAPSVPRRPHRSGRKALSAGVVRVFADGRTAKARAYAALYREIAEGRPLMGETSRMVSLMALDTLDLMAARREL